MILILVLLISLNTLAIIFLSFFYRELNNEIYELRARILEFELKDVNKKPATIHRIK